MSSLFIEEPLAPETSLKGASNNCLKPPLAYIAGPLGFSEAGREFHNGKLIPMVERSGFKVIDPWTLTPQSVIQKATSLPYGDAKRKAWQKANIIVGRNNADAIRDCDIIVAVLDGTDVDSGTAAEIGFGAALRKLIIGFPP